MSLTDQRRSTVLNEVLNGCAQARGCLIAGLMCARADSLRGQRGVVVAFCLSDALFGRAPVVRAEP